MIHRRQFVQTTAGAVLAGLAPRFHIVGAASKSGTRQVVIGQGEHRYECHHRWGELPSHLRWQTTHGVCVDPEGLIYITHQGYGPDVMDTVVVFDAKGKFVRSFGRAYHQGGHGIDLRVEGSEAFLYLCDIHQRQVIKTTLAGEEVWKKSYPAESKVYAEAKGYRPTNLAFAPDGGFYVADGYGSHFIHQYNAAGQWVRAWGGKGNQPGKLSTPHGIWLDDRPGREPSLIVADRANARLQYFSLKGEFLNESRDVLFPAHFDIRGGVLLVPDLHARVSLFDKDNRVIVHLGDDPDWIAEVKKFKIRTQPSEWVEGKFVHPHDACFDRAGNLFVVEWVQTGRVSFLRRVS